MTFLTVLRIGAVAARVASAPPAESRETLCRSCVRAHIESGYAADEVRVFCTLGGWLRPLEFAVRACTSYAPIRAGSCVGFAIELEDPEEMPA